MVKRVLLSSACCFLTELCADCSLEVAPAAPATPAAPSGTSGTSCTSGTSGPSGTSHTSGTKRHQRHQPHQRHQAALSGTKRHMSSFGILVDRSKEIYSHSRKGKRVSLKKTKLLCAEKVFQIADETLSLFDTLSSLCTLFHALKRSIPNNSQWNNCYCLPLSTSHNT